MKRNILFAFLLSSLFFLAACGNSENITDHVELSFYGLDTKGQVEYYVDESELIKKALNLKEDQHDYTNEKIAAEAGNIPQAYTVTVEPMTNLSNGDKVTVTIEVDKDKTKKIKGGVKEFVVEGLDEPEILTTKDVEEGLVFNFNGVDGRGVSQIDTIFADDFLNYINFQVENDGQLKNGEQAKIIINDDHVEESLNNNGYILAEDFNPTVEVKNLKIVADKATNIKNLHDIKRFLGEELNNKYKNTDYTYGSNTVYEIAEKQLMYRQFNTEEQSHDLESNNGNLIGIYDVKKYRVGNEKKLEDEFTAIFGFSGLILNDNNEANLAELKIISETKDKTYSIESVIQLYAGQGYEKVSGGKKEDAKEDEDTEDKEDEDEDE